jgi:hypothetical protein
MDDSLVRAGKQIDFTADGDLVFRMPGRRNKSIKPLMDADKRGYREQRVAAWAEAPARPPP